MQKLDVKLTLSAYDDLDRMTDYLIERNAAAAEKIYREIVDSIKKLGAFPQLGTLHEDTELRLVGYRKLVVGDYIVIYRVFDESVTVYHIFNFHQDYGRIFLHGRKDKD